MKKLLMFMCMISAFLLSHAQNAVNEDGTLRYRGNVAIMVTSHNFTFQNGVFKKCVDDELTKELKAALNAMAMQKFGNSCFGIVNRDNEAYANVMRSLEEQKLEDYIDGFSVKAKGEGADVLFLTDMTTYTEDKVCQVFISCRLISIENNLGFHYSMKTKPIAIDNTIEMSREVSKMIRQYQDFLYAHICDVYPEQFGIAKADGKKLYLQAYQPTGRVLATDNFYAFKYSHEDLKLGQNSLPVQVLCKITEASDPSAAGGFCMVKADKALKPSKDIILFKTVDEPRVTADPMLITYFALPYEPNTHDGFIKNRINNAVYDAITRHPGSLIIEQEHLPELKKERELQKTEDFLDGHVVNQMKAFGAQYMMHLDNFVMNGSQVSFQLSMVSIQQNKILRTVDVTTSIDNIENEMYKQVCERLAFPSNIISMDGKTATILSGWSLTRGSKIIVQLNKQLKNPMNGEVSYTNVQVCKCSVTEYMGCKFNVKIDEILSEEDFDLLSKNSFTGGITIMMDPSQIKTDMSTVSAVEKTKQKKEKSSKRKAFFNKLGSALRESVHVN